MLRQHAWILVVLGLLGLADKMSGQNLTAITWGHAVNSQQLLKDALNSSISFIEADIVLGRLINDSTLTLQPVMGHPPAVLSDITLSNFLSDILNFNRANPTRRKGVKLDFKSIEVFNGSLPLLRSMWSTMDYPVWINADIVPGPVNNVVTVPVNPTAFLQGCKEFPTAVLSIGWTTLWGPGFKNGSYTDIQVQSMVSALTNNNITGTRHPITFPVRAGIAALSVDTLQVLYDAVNKTNPVTFTIWSSANDTVNIEKLRTFIFHFGLDKVYLDVPVEVSSRLRLDDRSPEPAPAPGSGVSLGNLSVFQWIKYFVQFILNVYVLNKRF